MSSLIHTLTLCIRAVKKHNIATFAGAVGGSVGVLGLFALGLALNILRRRRQSARRDLLDRESLHRVHTNGSDDSPNMSGPTPFVPRYFPGTVIPPPDPPAYTVAVASNHNRLTSLTSSTGSTYSNPHRSYADIPPASPPPPLDEIQPPPPFPDAIPSPPSTTRTLHRAAGLPHSIPRSGERSHNMDPVGNDSSNSASAPELVPLLQSPDNDTRPRSRASSRRAVIRRQQSAPNHHQERDS